MSKKNENKNKGMTLKAVALNLVAMAAVIVAVVLITFRWINSYTEHGIAIKVPDVTGMYEAEGIQNLAQKAES